MIVDTMNPWEILRELEQDQLTISTKVKYLWDDIRKKALKRGVFPCSMSYQFTTKNKNKWGAVLTVFGKKWERPNNIAVSLYCIQEGAGGIRVHIIAPNNVCSHMCLTTLTSHFIARYRERMGLGGKSIHDTMLRLLRGSCIPLSTDKPLSGKNSDDAEPFYVCFEDGVGMGMKEDMHISIIKTFITHDMCKGRQEEMFGQLRNEEARKDREAMLGFVSLDMDNMQFKTNKKNFGNEFITGKTILTMK